MSTGKTYGYARVNTDGQTLDAQVSALQAAGAERIFSEKQSGAKTDRASLAKALAALESGDVRGTDQGHGARGAVRPQA
jgi:DNA invertase Pin-like site-specific DNA recombinase